MTRIGSTMEWVNFFTNACEPLAKWVQQLWSLGFRSLDAVGQVHQVDTKGLSKLFGVPNKDPRVRMFERSTLQLGL